MTRHTAADALHVPSDGTRRILPDSEGVFDAVARIGYEFEHAIADLVDNSHPVTPAVIIFGAFLKNFVHEAVLTLMVFGDFEDEVPVVPHLKIFHIVIH